MATGYTHPILDAPDDAPIGFRDFALTCARAFGAAIHQRDEPSSTPLRHDVVSDYYATNIIAAESRFSTAQLRTEDEWRALYDEERQKRLDDAAESEARRIRNVDRLGSLIAHVKMWEPPTEDHVEMKTFMLQQLEDTLVWDGKSYGARGIEEIEIWREREIETAQKSVEHMKKSYAAEVERVAGRNAWIDALVNSLPAS